MTAMLPPRSIVSFAPGGMERRMEQSLLTHAWRGPDGTLPRELASHQFATALRVDWFDEAATARILAHLRDPGVPISSMLKPVADRVRYSDGVKAASDELTRDLSDKIARTIDGMPGLSDPTKAALQRGLAEPEAVHSRVLEIPMDDGTIGTFLAWRVQDNRWAASDIWTGGGLRESTDMGPALARILASGMTFKNILHALGFGGAKGGIACDPKKLSLEEQQRLLTAYSYAFSTAIAMNRDKPAGDIGTTDSRYMDWLQLGIDDILGVGVAPGSFTGKTYLEGRRARDNGTPLRGIATGLGDFYAIQTLRGIVGWAVGSRLFVQGVGNAGIELAIKAAEAGLYVIAANDTTNAWIADGGLTPEVLRAIRDYKAGRRRLEEIPVRAQPSQALLDRLGEADIFVPAGTHRSVGVEEVRRLKPHTLVAPMANHPLTPEAEVVVEERELAGDLYWAHDSVTSGGGVTSSAAEARGNLRDRPVTRQEEDAYIRGQMERAVLAVHERRQREGVSTATAALREGLQRLSAIMPA